MMLHLRFTLTLAATAMALGLTAQQPRAVYDQPYRPQVHFSPARNWMNDPNGLVYFEGEYHLFYQYNPFGDVWGHMSWGHAVSRDLLHWQELPVALPEHDGEMIFTGSIVVDEHNTGGFCAPGAPCMVAVYTSARDGRQAQSLAYSRDRGRTWTFYAGNPVLDLGLADFRDPSVIWNDATHDWLMSVSLPNDHKVAFYRSPDLRHWTRSSTFGPAGDTAGQWECPDLVNVPYRDGEGSVWALKVGLNPGALQGGSGEQYFLGSFDGHAFTELPRATPQTLWSDYGKDSYCAISYNHLPAARHPVLQGWMDNWQYADKLPTSPWRGQMTMPRQLSAIHTLDGPVLVQEPIVEPLRAGLPMRHSVTLSGAKPSAGLGPIATPVELEIHLGATHPNAPFGVRLRSDADHYVEIAFDPARNTIAVDRTHAGVSPAETFPARVQAPLFRSGWDLRVVLDRSSIEVFAQGGSTVLTNLVFPAAPFSQVEVFHDPSDSSLTARSRIWALRSIWATKP
jgi:sucrose-6-phosphate hydrolase SacC (GH32 family)